ncbi:MAG: hypothetical protein PHF26_04065, partial [Candidatus Gracilibacteria bacterium]|nr:hypothetical protein [Candidatus Gracilibacteria bacterium]
MFTGVFAGTNVNAANITSNTNGGNWSDPNTWIGGTVPTINDNIKINGNVNLNQNIDLIYLEITKSGSLNNPSGYKIGIGGTIVNSGYFGGSIQNWSTINLNGILKNYGKLENTNLYSSGIVQNSGTFNSIGLQINGKTEFRGNPRFSTLILNDREVVLNNTRIETSNTSGTGVVSGTGGIIRAIGGGTLNSNISGSLALLEFSGGTTNIVGSYEA